MPRLKKNDTTAIVKYRYVGHVFVSVAHAVRRTGAPPADSLVTSLYVVFVDRNLCKVIEIGTSTLRERQTATVR